MAISQFKSNSISFSIELDQEDQIIDFNYQQNDSSKETYEILNCLKGMFLHDAAQALGKQTSLFNLSLLKITRFLLSLQGNVNQTEIYPEDLICRCFGLSKEQIVKDFEIDLLAGSACGTCRATVENLLPCKTFLTLIDNKKTQLSPIDFHIEATQVIKDYVDQTGIKAQLIRANGKILYIDLETGQKIFDPHYWKFHLQKNIHTYLGIRAEIILNLN
jgi:hypothetical protein